MPLRSLQLLLVMIPMTIFQSSSVDFSWVFLSANQIFQKCWVALSLSNVWIILVSNCVMDRNDQCTVSLKHVQNRKKYQPPPSSSLSSYFTSAFSNKIFTSAERGTQISFVKLHCIKIWMICLLAFLLYVILNLFAFLAFIFGSVGLFFDLAITLFAKNANPLHICLCFSSNSWQVAAH